MKQYEANSLTVLVLKALKESIFVSSKYGEGLYTEFKDQDKIKALIKRIETEQLDITLKSRNE